MAVHIKYFNLIIITITFALRWNNNNNKYHFLPRNFKVSIYNVFHERTGLPCSRPAAFVPVSRKYVNSNNIILHI